MHSTPGDAGKPSGGQARPGIIQDQERLIGRKIARDIGEGVEDRFIGSCGAHEQPKNRAARLARGSISSFGRS